MDSAGLAWKSATLAADWLLAGLEARADGGGVIHMAIARLAGSTSVSLARFMVGRNEVVTSVVGG